jgi:hypothetical protein
MDTKKAGKGVMEDARSKTFGTHISHNWHLVLPEMTALSKVLQPRLRVIVDNLLDLIDVTLLILPSDD